MNPNLDFSEQVHLVPGFLPVDMNGAGGAADWVSLENYEKVTIIFFKAVGTAADDPTVTLQQGKTAAGGTPIDLEVIDRVYTKQAASNLLSTGTNTLVTQTAANTYTNTDAGEQAAIWQFDVYAEDLADDYLFIQASVADVGSQAQLGCLLYALWPARYGEQALVTAIA